MIGRRNFTGIAVAVGIAVAATGGMALAHGMRGHGGPGGGGLFILAKAAGIDHSQVHTAFKNDSALKTDFANVKSAHQALMSCLASGGASSGGSCDTAINNFAGAQQTLTTEKYKVWDGLFKGAPNLNKSTSVLSQMQQLEQQRHALFASVFGKTQNEPGSPEAPPAE